MNATAFWWAIVTACIWGIVPLFEKFGLMKVEPYVGLFYRCLGVILGLLALGIFVIRPEHMRGVDFKTAGALILGGFLASFVAQIAFYHSLKLGEISRVVPISGSYPLIAFLVGILIFHESFTLHKMLGALCIVAGVWLIKG